MPTSIYTILETAANTLAFAETYHRTIATLTSRDDYLTDALEFLLAEKRRDDHVRKNKTYSRRENFVIRGFTTANNDNETYYDQLRAILRAMEIQQTNKIPCVMCQCLNNNRWIIVRLQLCRDRERIWTNQHKLKNNNYYTSTAEDFLLATLNP